MPDSLPQKSFARNPKKAIGAIAGIICIVILAYWVYGEVQRRDYQHTVTTLVKDSSQRLQNALTGPAAGDRGEADRQLTGVTRNLDTLQAMKDDRNPSLADAAESYVHTIREIVRQKAASLRHQQAVSDGMEDLLSHMGKRYTQGLNWTSEAIRLKSQLEQDYSLYRTSSNALMRLLESYPDERAKIAPLIDDSALPPANLAQASGRNELEAQQQLTAALNKIRNMPRNP